MLNREDLVVSVQHPDGSLSVEHADGTRITSLLQKRAPNPPQHTDQSDDDEEETSRRRAEEGERACRERSACETDGRSLSPKERAFLVEKEGCATVVMYPERHAAHVFLSDGTVLTADNKGSYEVRALRLKVQSVQKVTKSSLQQVWQVSAAFSGSVCSSTRCFQPASGSCTFRAMASVCIGQTPSSPPVQQEALLQTNLGATP